MSSLVGLLLSWLLLYKYLALFLVPFFGALLVPIPENTLFLAAGAFANNGYFNIWLSFAAAIAGNVAGDVVGYLLAARYGARVVGWLHVRIPKNVTRLEERLRRAPGLTIFLTRFVGTIDTFVNVFSGFSGVPFRTFLAYDALGNGVSIAAVLAIGYVVGDYWTDISGLVNTALGVIALIVVIALLGGYLYITRRGARGAASTHEGKETD